MSKLNSRNLYIPILGISDFEQYLCIVDQGSEVQLDFFLPEKYYNVDSKLWKFVI